MTLSSLRLQSLIILLPFILISGPVRAQTEVAAQALFNDANGACSRGEYADAVAIYESIVEQFGYSPAVLVNLGSCSAQSGDAGQAVLHLERARLLAWDDPEIDQLLSLVRKEAGLYSDAPPLTVTLTDVISFPVVALTGLGALLCLAVLQLLPRAGGQVRPLRLLQAAAVLLLLASLGLGALHFRRLDPWVVTGKESRLSLSPFDGAQSLGSILPGRLVYLQGSHGEYRLVRDETGREGWLKADELTPVIP